MRAADPTVHSARPDRGSEEGALGVNCREIALGAGRGSTEGRGSRVRQDSWCMVLGADDGCTCPLPTARGCARGRARGGDSEGKRKRGYASDEESEEEESGETGEEEKGEEDEGLNASD